MTKTQGLLQAMKKKAGFELVEETAGPSQLRLLGRVPLDRNGANMNNWLIVIRQLLTESVRAAWKVDISKDYFLLAGKVVYAWRVILQAPVIEEHLPVITGIVSGAPPTSRTEVTEMPLAGVGADRNSTAGGHRGAGPVDRVLLGPMAVHAKQMGMG